MTTCNSPKQGEYNPLRCVLEKGHKGYHSYVVAGLPYGHIKREQVKPYQRWPFPQTGGSE